MIFRSLKQARQLVFHQISSLQQYFNRHMDNRTFGKELTNLLQPEVKHKKSYSQIHGKAKDHSLHIPRQAPQQSLNRSLSLKEPEQASLQLINQDPQMVPTYFRENLEFLKKQEKETYNMNNYVSISKKISEQERAKLIDWLAKLHYKFKMFPETLFAVVSFVDQYLSVKETPLCQLQLLGIASLFLGAKFQETYHVPPLKQLITCCSHLYTAAQILDMEAKIVKQLNFNLIINSAFRFFEPYSKTVGLEPKNHHLAHYILQLSLLDPKYLNYPPSLMAASVVYLIKKIRKSENSWSLSMTSLVDYDEKDLKKCAKELCCLLQSAPELENCRSIKQKFSHSSFHEVTRIKLQRRSSK